jgi:hypothetical protein
MSSKYARLAFFALVLLFLPASLCGPGDMITGAKTETANAINLNITATYIYAQGKGLHATQTAEALLTQNAARVPKPDQFTKANLVYLGMKNLSAPNNGGPPNWCFTGAVPDAGDSPTPPLTVAPDGTLTGVCQGAIKSYYITWDGSSAGQWDPQTGIVSWDVTMAIFQEGNQPETTTARTVEIHGSGPVTNVDGVVSAHGTAEWTDTCKGGKQADGFRPCGPNPDQEAGYSANGTLDWNMTFVP